MNRKDRALNENMIYQEGENSTDTTKEYDVIGEHGTSYKVSISNIVTCTCPDFSRRRVRCKHIYFVLLRVLNLNNGEEDRNFYTNTRLKKMFSPENTDNEEKIVNSSNTSYFSYITDWVLGFGSFFRMC